MESVEDQVREKMVCSPYTIKKTTYERWDETDIHPIYAIYKDGVFYAYARTLYKACVIAEVL